SATREPRSSSTSSPPELVPSKSTGSDLKPRSNPWKARAMRRLTNSTYISLDGVVEEPHLWPSSGSSEGRRNAMQHELLRSCDALVLGRRTYDAFAPVFSARSGDPGGDQMNAMRKYVFSSTLRDPEWSNTTIVEGDPVAAVADLKSQPGKGI